MPIIESRSTFRVAAIGSHGLDPGRRPGSRRLVTFARQPGNEFAPTPSPYPSERDHRGGAIAEATVDQRDLVERARRGDHDAFAALAGAAIARLDAAARLILRDRELARDAVQDAMMRAWRDLPGLARPGAVRRVAPPSHRACLHRRGEASSPSADRGRIDRPSCAGRRRRVRIGHRSRSPRPGAPGSRARMARDRRPALLPGAAAAGGGGRPGHPTGHGQVAPPPLARGDADHGRASTARPGRTSSRKGVSHDHHRSVRA